MSCESDRASYLLHQYLEIPLHDTAINQVIGGLSSTSNVSTLHLVETGRTYSDLHLVAQCLDVPTKSQQILMQEISEDIRRINQKSRFTRITLHQFIQSTPHTFTPEEISGIPQGSKVIFSATILAKV